jgi:hypothetical protein
MSIHFTLQTAIAENFAERLATPPQVMQDAILVRLENGIELTIRYAASDAYSLRWTHRGRFFGIDTAPLHRHLKTFPNHYHDAAGKPHADPITDPADSPEENVSRLIVALLDEPALSAAQDEA